MVQSRQARGGLWSEYGIGAARDQFWASYESAKLFAQRQTFYEMIFSLFAYGGRDENIGSIIIGWILRFLVNLTFGLIFSIFSFMFRLWSFVSQFGVGFVEGAAFFFVALFAGCSMVALYIALIWGTVAGTFIYARSQALAGGRRRQQQHLHHQ